MRYAGIKEVKARFSGYLDEVQQGEQVVITEHGREVAMIVPISRERMAIRVLIETGRAHWSGGKPKGIFGRRERITIRGNPLSDTVLEERR